MIKKLTEIELWLKLLERRKEEGLPQGDLEVMMNASTVEGRVIGWLIRSTECRKKRNFNRRYRTRSEDSDGSRRRKDSPDHRRDGDKRKSDRDRSSSHSSRRKRRNSKSSDKSNRSSRYFKKKEF